MPSTLDSHTHSDTRTLCFYRNTVKYYVSEVFYISPLVLMGVVVFDISSSCCGSTLSQTGFNLVVESVKRNQRDGGGVNFLSGLIYSSLLLTRLLSSSAAKQKLT